MALQCCLLCSLSIYIYMYIYTQQLFLKKNRCTRFLQEEQHQRIARIKEREKWRTSRSSARLISIQDAHRSIGCRVQRHLRHTIISIQTAPRILADEYGRVLVRSTQIHRSDPRKQCGVLGRSGPVRLLRWTKTDGERERERRRPGEHGVSRDKPVMTEHAPMTRLANEGHPSGTIRTVTSASLTVLHSVPERLGRFVSEVCFLFFFITA